MSEQPPPISAAPPGSERDLRAVYAAVLVVEALVLLGLWAFSKYFG